MSLFRELFGLECKNLGNKFSCTANTRNTPGRKLKFKADEILLTGIDVRSEGLYIKPNGIEFHQDGKITNHKTQSLFCTLIGGTTKTLQCGTRKSAAEFALERSSYNLKIDDKTSFSDMFIY